MPDRNRLWRSSIPLVLAAHVLILVPSAGAQARTRHDSDPDSALAWSSDLLRAAENRAGAAERAVHVLEGLKRGDQSAANVRIWPAIYLDVFREAAQKPVPPFLGDAAHVADSRESLPGFALSSSSQRRLVSFIRDYLRSYGLPEQLVAVPFVESAFDPLALSPKGALGLWQLMPDTARQFGLAIDDRNDERKDPVRSTVVAVQYLTQLYARWGDWSLALAAYNAGPKTVEQALGTGDARRFWSRSVQSRLPEETRDYVARVLQEARRWGGLPSGNKHEEGM